MKKAFLVIAILATLAACKTKDEERIIIKSILPDDCEMIELGSFGRIDELVAIRCGSQVTTNIAEVHSNGKTSTTYGAAVHMEAHK